MRKRRSEVGTEDVRPMDSGRWLDVPIQKARPIVVLDHDCFVWGEQLDEEDLRQFVSGLLLDGSLVWVDPPAGKDGQSLVQRLRSAGVVARLVPAAPAPAAVPEQVAAVPAPARAELRTVVLELARAAEADYPGVTDVCEQTLSEGGL